MEVFPLAQEMGLVVKGVEINFFLNALFTLFIYLFIFGCVGSSSLCEGFL